MLHIELPPLRERREDIPLLVRQFSQEVSERLDRPFSGITDEAMEILIGHDWPGNVRELRNLVESMVVLAPGERIQPRDIPDEIRRGEAGPRGLLPAPIPRARDDDADGLRPPLEFIFRTLVDMRVDLDDLRREFEAWRDDTPQVSGGREVGLLTGGEASRDFGVVDLWEAEAGGLSPLEPPEEVAPEPPRDEVEGIVVFRPGMTMEDLEREAIVAALAAVGGNRRKAAERLQIGERTLYRKIKKFGLDG